MNRLGLCAVGIIVFSGAGLAQRTLDRVVAQVNNEVILQSELAVQERTLRDELAAALQGVELEGALAERTPDALRDLIDRSLLRQKGEEYGIRTELEVIRTMEQMRQEYEFDTLEDLEAAIAAQGTSVEFVKDSIRMQYISQQVLQRDVYSKVVLTTEEIRKYYDANLNEFDQPAGVQIQEIVISIPGESPEEVEDARSRAEAALARLQNGEEFAALAREVSEAPSRTDGGDLGFFATGDLRADYEEIAAGLDRGDFSEIVELPGELVILNLQNRHGGGIMSFELARSGIENFLFSQQLEPKIREYLTDLRANGFVSVRDGYVDTGGPES